MSAAAEPTAPPFGDTDGAWPSAHAAYRPRLWQVLVAAVAFVLVLLDVLFDGVLRRVEGTAASSLLGLGVREHDVLGTAGYLLSLAGGRGTNLAWIVVLCVVIFAQRRTLAPLAQALSATALMYVAIYPIKEWLSRSYPADPAGDYLHAVAGLGGAFPSGHQVNATLLASVGAWIAMEYIRSERVRRIVAIYAIVAPIISAVAVLLMGYHWISDVIAGACAGIVLLWFVRWFWATSLGLRITLALSFAEHQDSHPS